VAGEIRNRCHGCDGVVGSKNKDYKLPKATVCGLGMGAVKKIINNRQNNQPILLSILLSYYPTMCLFFLKSVTPTPPFSFKTSL
jgi:hypothetical protein